MYVPEHLTEIFTFENLLKAFRSSASNHRHKADVQEFFEPFVSEYPKNRKDI